MHSSGITFFFSRRLKIKLDSKGRPVLFAFLLVLNNRAPESSHVARKITLSAESHSAVSEVSVSSSAKCSLVKFNQEFEIRCRKVLERTESDRCDQINILVWGEKK